MSSKIELLPCPFCGGAPTKRSSSGDERDGYADRVSYVCSGCGCAKGACGDSAKGGYADNSKVEESALAAWNTRIDAPPELAELQATIAQQAAEIERLRQLPTRNALIKERERLKDEIERLKGGQGEPFGWFTDDHVDDKSATTYTPAVADRWRSKGWPVTPLYTSQPAPVSVVTREQVEVVAESIYWQWSGREGFVPWVKGCNSLKQDEARSIAWTTLNKVKELNK